MGDNTSMSFKQHLYIALIPVLVTIISTVVINRIQGSTEIHGSLEIQGSQGPILVQLYDPAPPIVEKFPPGLEFSHEPPATSPTPESTTPPSPTADQEVTIFGTTGSLSWSYVGDALNGLPHGIGRKDIECGSWFYGEWSDGHYLHGEGYFIFESGAWFHGNLRYGHWTYGVFMSADMIKYTGQFIFNDNRHQRHGHGRSEWPNGNFYEGGWHHDRRHGSGVTFNAASQVRQYGEWIDNVLMPGS